MGQDQVLAPTTVPILVLEPPAIPLGAVKKLGSAVFVAFEQEIS